MPSQGEIILVPIPFTDFSSSKRRPVIVLSKNQYQMSTADMIVVAMTSNRAITPYSFEITSADLTVGTLNRPGRVRVDRIYTVAQSIAVKTFGKVNDVVIERIRTILDDLSKP